MAAKVLTEAGANVLMLEAGPMFDTRRDSKMMAWPYQSPRRGLPIPERQFGEFDAGWGGWTLEGEPYTSAPGDRFDWFRTRMLGGRTNHWGRISLRFGPDDFRRKSLDGLGDDWPITYDDLKPYYDSIDRYIGLFGSNEGLPNDPDGIFQPPPRPRCYELLIKQASERLNIRCIPIRLSILTQPLNGRPACHYCGQCGRGVRRTRQLFVALGAAAAGARHQAPHDCHERHGPRGHGGRRWPGHRRDLRRQEHRPREPCAGADRRDGRERLRDRAAAAQLEVGAFSAGPWQLERRRRQVPHRHHRHQRPRLHPEDDERRAAQRRRRQRLAPLHAVVGRQQEARFSARLSHRAWRRAADAGLRHARRRASLQRHRRGRAPGVERRLRQATEGRLPPLLRRRRWALPGAAK